MATAERIPRELKFESLSFTVLRLGDGRLAFDYYEAGRGIVVKRPTIEALRAKAQDVATRILNAETAALDVTAEDRRIYLSAQAALAPFGLSVDAGARQLAELLRLAAGADPTEALRFYL